MPSTGRLAVCPGVPECPERSPVPRGVGAGWGSRSCWLSGGGATAGCPPRTKRCSRRWSWPRSSGPRGAGRRQDRFGAL